MSRQLATETLPGGSTKSTTARTWRAEYFTQAGTGYTMRVHREAKVSIDGEVVKTEKLKTISKTFDELSALEPINGLTFAEVDAYLTALSDLLCEQEEQDGSKPE